MIRYDDRRKVFYGTRKIFHNFTLVTNLFIFAEMIFPYLTFEGKAIIFNSRAALE